VDRAFAAVRTNDNWNAAKEDVAASLRQWYRTTHAVSAMANAQDMSAILEAYWTLAAKVIVSMFDERTLCAE
jgi:interferon-induced GTP-binding protein Mx1